MNDRELITRYYANHRDEVVSYITVRIADRQAAEDLVQDLFIRLLSDLRLITPLTLPNLVYVMARHAVADYYRHRRVREEYEHYILRGSHTQEAESVFSARMLSEQMERVLERLPQACGRIYRLHIYDGMKTAEIAKELSLPYKQVEHRLGQARKTVRQQLRRCAG